MKKLLYLLSGIIVSVSAKAQLQNLDFEHWDHPVTTEIFSNQPTGWQWTNSSLIHASQKFYYPPSSQAQHQHHALALGVWYNYDKDAALQHTSINSRPLSLNGFYTYTHNTVLGLNGRQTDTALVCVYLTKFNQLTHHSDTIGRGIFEVGTETQTYLKFTANITYTSELIPDSIIILLDPSLCRREGRSYQCEDALSSFFTVDNLSLNESFTGIETIVPSSTFVVFPNPTPDFINLTLDANEVVIRDITGKLVEQSTPTSAQINLQHLQPGTYFMETLKDAELMRAKFIKR